MARLAPRAWQALPNVKIPGCSLYAAYSPGVLPFYRELDDANHVNNALHAKTTDMLATMPKDTLRWQVSADPSKKELPKGIQRTVLASRWKHAFNQALHDFNYTRDGRRRETGKQGIVGTLSLAVPGAVGMKWPMEDLVKQCKSVVIFIKTKQLATQGLQPSFRFRSHR